MPVTYGMKPKAKSAAKAKPAKKAKCAKTIIAFKTKRGKVEFPGHKGPGCPERKKPSTRHLKPWKDAMKEASPRCAKAFKSSGQKFRSCIRAAMKAAG